MTGSISIPDSIRVVLDGLSDRYSITTLDRQGGNGYVFKAKNKILDLDVAIKFYYWGSGAQPHTEPRRLLELNSPHILQVFDAGIADDEWAYFVTLYCSEGDLDARLENGFVSNSQAIALVSDVLSGLSVLHAARLIHRDLKPANIYLRDARAIIGDFGSVASLPEGADSVAASQHSVLYRPPESVETNAYTTFGDIYQTGVVLFQLLGGRLPYNEVEWLDRKQREQYNQLNYPENTCFADQCLLERIRRDRLLDFTSLHPWTSDKLKRVVRKATHLDPFKRFSSAADFLVKLTEALTSLKDWVLQDGCLTLSGPTSYRIIKQNSVYRAQKRKTSAEWRNDNTLDTRNDLRQLILDIEARA
jgi:eukaryotic-like serine/threonine-protein kinase